MIKDGPLPAQPADHHFQIGEMAARNLGKMASGNGLKAEQVRLASENTVVHQLPGIVVLTIAPGITAAEKPGRVPAGETLGSKGDVMQKITGHAAALLKDPGALQNIKAALAKDAGGGWGMETLKLRLPGVEKNYCTVEQCLTCKGLTTLPCVACAAQGAAMCRMCSGSGYAPCTLCAATGQMRDGDGGMMTCTACRGEKRMICRTCNGKKLISCHICHGDGKTDCAQCQRTGHRTYTWHAVYDAEASFHLERGGIPPDIQAVADTLGIRQMAVDGHAEIFRLEAESTAVNTHIPLIAFLPVCRAQYTVEGKPYPALVAGLKGEVVEMEPFLDRFVKPGIAALMKITQGTLATNALINTACKYRLLRTALAETSRQTRRGAYQKIIREYPVVLSDKYARAAVKYASDALLALGRGPRVKGLIGGAVLSALLSAAWFLALRGMAKPFLGAHALAADIAVWVLGWLAAFAVIKVLAHRAMRRILPQDVGAGPLTAPAGAEGYYAGAATLATWLALAVLAPDKVEWAVALLAKLSLNF